MSTKDKQRNNCWCWYNYVTGENEYRETPTDFINYIPQKQKAMELYNQLINTGHRPMDAALDVLDWYND